MTGESPSAQSSALEHLWPHGDDMQWKELSGGGLRVYASAQGCTLTDVQGRRYFDGIASLFLVNAGHGRREIGEAMARQASRIAYTSASNSTNLAAIELAETIARLAPGDLDRVFLCSGGSEAVESALKIAKQLQALRGFPRRYKVIARRGSYHGTTFGAASLTASAREAYFGPFMPGVSKVPSPNHFRAAQGIEPLSAEQSDLACARALEEEILAQGPEHVAAFIAEPISVSNGMHIPTAAYWQEVRRVCDRYGVLLIMDEVITGYGRTGAMFAAERFGVVPDLMTMAKGLSSGYAPVAAVAVRAELFEPFQAQGAAINHLLTFGGHAVAAAAANANVAILEREALAERSAEMGELLLDLARGLAAHPTVGDVRGGMGLLCGIELVKSRDTMAPFGTRHPFIRALAARTLERGLITRVWDVLHLAPPLIATPEELERAVAIVDECLDALEKEHAHELG